MTFVIIYVYQQRNPLKLGVCELSFCFNICKQEDTSVRRKSCYLTAEVS